MIDILLGPGLDGATTWKHLLRPGAARAGWEATGLLGLVRRVGTLLGVPHALVPHGRRVAAVEARLARLDDGARSYSRSRADDPLGVAAHLLGLRDKLVLAGWDGRPLEGSERLADLSVLEAEAPLPAGLPDVVRALRARLPARLPAPLRITVLGPASAWPPVALELVRDLERAGAEIRYGAPEVPLAAEGTDLGRLQRALLDSACEELCGDGSVQILEAETPWEAAELLAHVAPDAETLVLGDEGPLLDAVRRTRGLPALGQATPSRWRPALQVLPLRLDLLFHPRDPQQAIELLALPRRPLPARVARRLIGALQEQPGIGGPHWQAAVERCVAEDERPDRLRARIASWLEGEVHDPLEGIPCGTAAGVVAEVAAWARARAQLDERPPRDLVQAAAVARTLEQMLRTQAPDRRLTRLQLQQFHDAAVGSGLAAETEAEAGAPALTGAPEAVLPGGASVAWWGFVGDRGGPGPDPWSDRERAALETAGVRLQPPGARRAAERWGWRRPVLGASERLVLVRWRTSGGEAASAHPLEDELLAVTEGLDRCVLRCEDRTSVPVPSNPDVAPRQLWRLPAGRLTPHVPLSATSIGRMLGCPLQYVLHHVVRLRGGAAAGVKDGSRLLGDLAHTLLQEVLLSEPLDRLTPDRAAAHVETAFDARVEAEAAPLLRPERTIERQRARRVIAEAARALVALLRAGEWHVDAIEQEVGGTFAGLRFAGWIDLLVSRDGQPGVIDLKLGRSANRRAELMEGRALQLALYARGLGGGGPLPPTGYFTLTDGRMLTTDAGAFPGATEVDGPSAEETLLLAERDWKSWLALLEDGLVVARDSALGDPADAVSPRECPDGADPPCRWCDFRLLCTFTTVEGP